MTNRLGGSTSPYLLQHKDNPVHWQEWDDAAFADAERRDVPIFLSSGYSSCHWCHVMAHESFEDDAVAAYVNEHFVAIKLDRDERPDVDAVYMTVLQAMTGHGGWPMSIFMTSSREPFYAGTYYPPQSRGGSPAFLDVLTAITDAWQNRRGDLTEAAVNIIDTMRTRVASADPSSKRATPALLDRAVEQLSRSFDPRAGGFGGAPKFPPTSVLEFLLRRAATSSDRDALRLAQSTCEAMARGGMYDQLGGGFARYSVDIDWVVPHFEKMLYDNALLLRNYSHLAVIADSSFARRVAGETADFLIREMQTESGGFAASLDADSAGGEGNFYVWTPAELVEVLGADAAWAAQLLLVTSTGTFEAGASVLQLRRDPDDGERWQRVRSALLAARDRRVRPARDDSVITAWNGLVIGGLARAGALLDESRYVDAAHTAAAFLVDAHLTHVAADGIQLARVSRGGVCAGAPGVLEDYAQLAAGLLDLYMVTGETCWYSAAEECIDVIIGKFRGEDGRLRDTAVGSQDLVLDLTEPADNATPSGVASAAGALLTYSTLSGRLVSEAENALAQLTEIAEKNARFAGWGLAAATTWLAGSGGVAVVGVSTDPNWRDLRQAALQALPAGFAIATTDGAAKSMIPLLQERGTLDGSAAAFVCRNSVCQLPVSTAAELAGLLRGN
jgi:uncharacterized protein YyaL (SSP411 family)